jgi:three-Cys-motif partner protein
MMSRGPTKNSGPAEVGVWAKEKLDALARYLDFYTKVLKNTRWRTVYFDGFAGGGQAAIRQGKQSIEPLALFDNERVIEDDERELIDGSPRIALSIPNPFDRYVFVDPDPVRAAELRDLKAQHGDKVVVLDCTATEGVEWLLRQNIKKSSHRGLAFLDPFGANLDWESVQKLAETGLFEVIINFALDMGIVRVLTNSAELPDAWVARLDCYFGGHEWFDEVYHRPGAISRKVEKGLWACLSAPIDTQHPWRTIVLLAVGGTSQEGLGRGRLYPKDGREIRPHRLAPEGIHSTRGRQVPGLPTLGAVRPIA